MSGHRTLWKCAAVLFSVCVLLMALWYVPNLLNAHASPQVGPHRSRGVVSKSGSRHMDGTSSRTVGKDLQQKLPSFDEVRDSIRVERRWFDRLESFILFIGYERSGHTLVSALLDAHPHVVIAHEYHLLDALTRFSRTQKTRDFILTEMYRHSAFNAQYGRSSQYPVLTAGYHYQVNLWEGKCDGYVQVIGDKRGAGTSMFLTNKANMKYVTELHDIVQLPFKVMHIVRNPFDDISSMVLHRAKVYDEVKAKGGVFDRPSLLRRIIDHYFLEVRSVVRLNSSGLNFIKMMTAYSEDVMSNTQSALQSMCGFLAVECSADYLNGCARVVSKSSSGMRDLVRWSHKMKTLVQRKMKAFAFLNRYSFLD